MNITKLLIITVLNFAILSACKAEISSEKNKNDEWVYYGNSMISRNENQHFIEYVHIHTFMNQATIKRLSYDKLNHTLTVRQQAVRCNGQCSLPTEYDGSMASIEFNEIEQLYLQGQGTQD